MAKNIQMNVLGSDGQYEVVYPQTTVENIVNIQDNYYTKNETLTNTTAALFGQGTEAVPDDVLRILSRAAIADESGNLVTASGDHVRQVFMESGNYTGNGRVTPITIQCGFRPLLALWWEENKTTVPDGGDSVPIWITGVNKMRSYYYNWGGSSRVTYIAFSVNDNSFSFHIDTESSTIQLADYQYNKSGVKYYYAILGVNVL